MNQVFTEINFSYSFSYFSKIYYNQLSAMCDVHSSVATISCKYDLYEPITQYLA